MSSAKVIKTLPWVVEADQLPSKMRKDKKKVKINIIHDIFLKCSKIITDPYWIKIYESASQGKFPRGFSYDSESYILSYHNMTKVKDVSLDMTVDNSLDEILLKSITFFRIEGGIKSPSDLDKERTEINDMNDKLSSFAVTRWGELRQKSLKITYITQYVELMGKLYNFNTKQEDKLMSWVLWGLDIKAILPKDIIFDNGIITEINGVHIEQIGEKINIYIDDEHLSSREKIKIKSVGKKVEKSKLMRKWDKILKNVCNKVRGIADATTTIVSTTIN